MAQPHSIVIKENSTIQEVAVPKSFGKIICPSRMLVCGPSMSGKSTFILGLVKHRDLVYDQTFERILYCLPEDALHLHQDFVKEMEIAFPNLEIIEGLPRIHDLHIKDNKNHKLLILDDLMISVFDTQTMVDLITKDSHHCNCSVIITSQNYFHPSKYGRTFVRNCSEKVLFFDKTDAKQLGMLSLQIYPTKPTFLKSCFDWIFKYHSHEKLKYLLIDSSILSHFPHNALVRTFILPNNSGKVEPVLFFPSEEK